MLRLLAVLALSWGCGTAAPCPTVVARDPSPPMTETAPSVDDSFLEQYAETGGFRLGTPGSVTFTPNGREVLFLRSGPRSSSRDLYAFDLESREERVILTSRQLLRGGEERLSPEERARRERMRLSASGIARYELSSDGSRILVPLSGTLYVVDRVSGAVRTVGTEEGYPNDAHFTPDGSRIVCVRNGDLYVIELASNRERRLTDTASEHVENGLPEFVAQEEMRRFRGYWVSPDGGTVAYQQTDTSGVEQLTIADPMYPDRPPTRSPYPRPGTDNAIVKLGLVPIAGGRTRWVSWDREAYPYLASVVWSSDAPLTLVVQNRRQTEHAILTVDPRSGATDAIHVETDDAWVNLDQDVPRWIDGGRAFLWTTEREGYWQLEVRGRDGGLARTLTTEDIGYQSLIGVDENAGVAWIQASSEPTETHVATVPLSGEGSVTVITEEPGVHGAQLGGNGLSLLTSSTRDGRESRSLRRGDETIAELRSVAEEPPFVPAIELVTVGERELRAVVIRPREFDASRSYPVLVAVYGGPHAQTVRATARRYLMHQWYADHGYVVVSIDGRGTPSRGRAWERTIAGNFIDAPMEDQVDGLRGLGERFGEMDLTNVGIYGWSFGGYFSALAVMMHPEAFHAGVAGAPVADWRDYDTHYTERYLGLPDENADGYARSSVLTHAPELTRPLLIVHGTVDDNVYFTHAIKMSHALFAAGRDHEFLPLSGFTHMVRDPDATKALHHRILGFFDRHLR